MAARETKTNDLAKALDSLARHLARRDHSRHELLQKLQRRFDPEISALAIATAEQRGWLGDEHAIAGRLAEALARKHKSQKYIEAQLRRRRLPVPAVSGDSELTKVKDLLRKKFGERTLTLAEKAKAFRYLRLRGFADRWIRKGIQNEE